MIFHWRGQFFEDPVLSLIGNGFPPYIKERFERQLFDQEIL